MITRYQQKQIHPKQYCKILWTAQSNQLVKLFNENYKDMVNSIIKINDNFDVDYTIIDKILVNMVGISKDVLVKVLASNGVGKPQVNLSMQE